MHIGILGLQGDYAKHQAVLLSLDVETTIVRYQQELNLMDGLIIPGGESTTLTHLMKKTGMGDAIKAFSSTKPVFGTCAGLIMMAQDVDDTRIHPLGILNVSVSRNGYGRQIHSFTDTIDLTGADSSRSIQGTFIRAPRITSQRTHIHPLVSYAGEIVGVKQGMHIGLSFHPELSGESYFHELFLTECQNSMDGVGTSNAA